MLSPASEAQRFIPAELCASSTADQFQSGGPLAELPDALHGESADTDALPRALGLFVLMDHRASHRDSRCMPACAAAATVRSKASIAETLPSI